MVGHAIFTTGKNTPTPGTGTRTRRVFACDHNRVRLSCFACHRMYRLWWRDLFRFCASRFRFYVCTGIAYLLVFCFCPCQKWSSLLIALFRPHDKVFTCFSTFSCNLYPLGGYCNTWCQGWGVKPNCKRCKKYILSQ